MSEKFLEPLKKAADGVAEAFKVDKIPSAAYLDDIWVFDGNYAVAAVALLGSNTATIERRDLRRGCGRAAPEASTPTGGGR